MIPFKISACWSEFPIAMRFVAKWYFNLEEAVLEERLQNPGFISQSRREALEIASV